MHIDKFNFDSLFDILFDESVDIIKFKIFVSDYVKPIYHDYVY